MARFFLAQPLGRLTTETPAMAQALWGIDATFLRAFWTSCRLLSPDQASGLGGRLLRGLGPRLRQHRKLCRNLATAFPEWSDEKVGAVAKDSWENIGRVLAEIPHMGRICGANWRTYIETGLQLNRAREMTSDRPVIFVSAHLGNWELTPSYRPAARDPAERGIQPSAEPDY